MRKIVLVNAVALALLGSAGPSLADTPAPPTISVLTAQTKAIAEDLNVTGSFAAGELVLVSPEIEGLAVTEFLAEEGDTVKKGQVLARLNSQAIDIQIQQTMASLARNDLAAQQAQNQIDQAQVTVNRTSADLDRTKQLRSTGVATQQTLDQQQAAYDLAAAQLAGAKLALQGAKADRQTIEAQLAAQQLNKARTEIKSPVDGYISSRNVQIGGIASGQKNAMYEIVANSVIKLLAEVPEADMPRLKLGQKATITINGYDKPVTGEVKLISPEINQQTRIGIAHIAVDGGTRVALGAFGRARIALAAADGVALPLTAVTFGNAGPTVQIVKDGKVQVRKVSTGLVGTDEIQITDGVAPGETFVARAGSFVRDGDAVTPVPLAAQ